MNNDNYNGVEPTKTAPVASLESMDSLNQEKNDEAGKVTFSKGDGLKNGESVVEINAPPDVIFSGMGKEELSKYANDPFWVRVRWFLFIVFWLTWVGMLAAAIIIVVLAPKCSPPPNLTDLQKGSVYEVLTHSFKDGMMKQDGVGDFTGISDRIEHFKSLGVKMVLLAPIFKSASLTQPEYGYGVTQFDDVEPQLGSLSDFDKLIETAKKNDVKILLDMIPNHSSDQHPWFVKSVNKEANYTNYYVWKASSDENPPDDTMSVFGESAWTLDSTRNEWYLHRFGPKQPDFNYANPKVREELMSILGFWLDRGVSGFRLNSVEYIFEDDDDQVKLSGFLNDIRQYLNQYKENDDLERTLLTDATGTAAVEAAVSYYASKTSQPSVVPFNFDLIKEVEMEFDGRTLNATISNFISSLPSWGWPIWVSGSEYKSRLASQQNPEMIDGIAMIQTLLPGTPSIYYGEEIGMHNVNEREDSCQNITETFNCDAARTPMQWDDSPNAGFSTNSTWISVGDDYSKLNVKEQMASKSSHFKVYQKLMSIREEKALLHGETGFPLVDKDIFSFTRVRKGSPGYLVVVNGGTEPRHIDFTKVEPIIGASSEGEAIAIPFDAQIEVSSVGTSNTAGSVKMDNLNLAPSEGLVIQFVPIFKKV